MTQPKAGGYLYRQELTQAQIANREIRENLRQLADSPSPQRAAVLIAKASIAAGNNLDALNTLNAILTNRKATP